MATPSSLRNMCFVKLKKVVTNPATAKPHARWVFKCPRQILNGTRTSALFFVMYSANEDSRWSGISKLVCAKPKSYL